MIQQTHENKYIFTIKISEKQEEGSMKLPNDKQKFVISQIDLNPEDIIVLQKFVNVLIYYII